MSLSHLPQSDTKQRDNGLRAVSLALTPPPFELNAEGTRRVDLFFAELFGLFEQFPAFSLLLEISGSVLENLKARGRTAFLNRLAQLSSTKRIEIVKGPFFPLSTQLISEQRISEGLLLQERFWKEFGAVASTESFFSASQKFGRNVELPNGLKIGLFVSRISSLNQVPEVAKELKNFIQSSSEKFILSAELRAAGCSAVGLEQEKGVSETYLASRVNLFWERLSKVPSLVEERFKKAQEDNRKIERIGSEENLHLAIAFAHQASGPIVDQPLLPEAQRSVFDLVLRGEVELEKYLHPDADPTIGWIRLLPNDHGSLVTTQLTNAFLSPTGALTEYDYKPRKFTLFGAFPGHSFELEPSIPPERRIPSTGKIIRRTLDLLSLRFEEEFVYSGKSLHFVREYTFKAGIGAHLPNATTGFSLEYWVEGEIPKDLKIDLSVVLSLPSPSITAGLLKPLLCVGGVGEGLINMTEHQVLDGKSVPGGLFGVRAIDSVEDLVQDFRTSKQLEQLTVEPMTVQGVAQGVVVKFTVSAARIYSDDKSNTLFFSIE